jgi:CheY-like chemotaxis protein
VLAQISPPHLILLDYRMPVMNGSQFLARKRRNPKLRMIPVVILSAWSREWGKRIDAADVLTKPVDLERLRTLVTDICTGVRPAQVPTRGAWSRMSPLALSGRAARR